MIFLQTDIDLIWAYMYIFDVINYTLLNNNKKKFYHKENNLSLWLMYVAPVTTFAPKIIYFATKLICSILLLLLYSTLYI